MKQTPDELPASTFPGQAKEISDSCRKAFLARLTSRIREERSIAVSISPGDLLGKLPELYDSLMNLLSKEGAPDAESICLRVAHEHGILRSTSAHFNTDQIFEEFAWLQEGLCELFENTIEVELKEKQRLLTTLTKSLREAARALSNNASSSFKETGSQFEQMVRSVVDHAIFMVDSNGIISTWNEGAERIKEYRAEEAIGRHLNMLYRDEDRANGRAEHNLAMAKKAGRYEEEWWRRKKDGTLFWAKVTITALYSERGDLRGFLKVISDVTERKRYQEELQRVNHDLELFASTAAHDLREPLRTVTTFLRVIDKQLRDSRDTSIGDYRALIIEAVKRMGALIDTLLSYARSGGSNLCRETVDAKECAEAALARLGTAITQSKAKIHLGRFPSVEGDRVLLTQLFQNLIGNAIKFRAPKTPLRIDVEARPLEKEWLFSVRDNGIGMTTADAKRVFEPFHRAQTEVITSGSGLGLSICRRIIERHGGRIWAESAMGKGATFFFTLPLGSYAANTAGKLETA